MPTIAPKAAGCVVTIDDFSRICISVSCYCAQLGCGSVTATLGLCVPFFAAKFNVSMTDLGILFTLSGIGYFSGVTAVSKIIDHQDSWFLSVSRFVVLCACAFMAGGVAFMLLAVGNIWTLKLLIMLQFMGIGGIDVISTVLLAEMWGQRVQPWMQARSAFYSIGGMVAPMVAGSGLTLTTPLITCGLFCASTAVGGVYDSLYTALCVKCRAGDDANSDGDVGDGGGAAAIATEHTPLTRHHMGSRSRARSASIGTGGGGGGDSYRNSPASMPSSSGFRGGLVSVSHALAVRSGEAKLESDELAMLDLIIQSKHLDVDKGVGHAPVVGDIVTTVLDATPYCNITELERNDPLFEPNINKTLSYATKAVVRTLSKAQEYKQASSGLTAGQVDFVDDMVESIDLVPRKARIMLATMALLFYSLMQSFVGWLPTYFKLAVFPGDTNWSLMGAQMVSTYFFFMFSGCVASIPCSVYISITKMMKFHLALLLLGGVILQLAIFTQPNPMASLLLTAAALLGYGISAIFPLIVTLANDYGFTMDSVATSGLLKGVATGGICVPLILGYLMQLFGPAVLIVGLAAIVVGLAVTYVAIHFHLTAEAETLSDIHTVQRRKRTISSMSDTKSTDYLSAHNSAIERLHSLSMAQYELSV